MTKEMEKQEALHFKPDVRIDDDPKTVEDACTGRLKVTIFDDKPVLHHARRGFTPEIDHVAGGQVPDQATAMQLVARDLRHALHCAWTILAPAAMGSVRLHIPSTIAAHTAD